VLNELGLNTHDLHVRVENTWHWHHKGYFHGDHDYELPGKAKHLITARVPVVVSGAPIDLGLRGGPPPIDPQNWCESLVCIIAHEGTHLLQYLTPPTGKPYRARRRVRRGKRVVWRKVLVQPRHFSELPAEWAEFHFLERYRQEHDSQISEKGGPDDLQ
jgi:hypothetical protein